MKISIIIPTMSLEATMICVDSIITYTDLMDIEIILIANNVDSQSSMRNYIEYQFRDKDLKIYGLWYDKPLGVILAFNAGIKKAKGEYILLFHDDCKILRSEKNLWINMLLEPFSNPMMAITGPVRMQPKIGANELLLDEGDIEYGYIDFFLALIKRKIFFEIGLLDETLLSGADVDFCLKARRRGYDIQQVPSSGKLKNDRRIFIGSFPAWHEGGKTVNLYYGKENWEKITKNDSLILTNRFKMKK